MKRFFLYQGRMDLALAVRLGFRLGQSVVASLVVLLAHQNHLSSTTGGILAVRA